MVNAEMAGFMPYISQYTSVQTRNLRSSILDLVFPIPEPSCLPLKPYLAWVFILRSQPIDSFIWKAQQKGLHLHTDTSFLAGLLLIYIAYKLKLWRLC